MVRRSHLVAGLAVLAVIVIAHRRRRTDDPNKIKDLPARLRARMLGARARVTKMRAGREGMLSGCSACGYSSGLGTPYAHV